MVTNRTVIPFSGAGLSACAGVWWFAAKLQEYIVQGCLLVSHAIVSVAVSFPVAPATLGVHKISPYVTVVLCKTFLAGAMWRSSAFFPPSFLLFLPVYSFCSTFSVSRYFPLSDCFGFPYSGYGYQVTTAGSLRDPWKGENQSIKARSISQEEYGNGTRAIVECAVLPPPPECDFRFFVRGYHDRSRVR